MKAKHVNEVDRLVAEQVVDLRNHAELIRELFQLDARIAKRKKRLLALLPEALQERPLEPSLPLLF